MGDNNEVARWVVASLKKDDDHTLARDINDDILINEKERSFASNLEANVMPDHDFTGTEYQLG